MCLSLLNSNLAQPGRNVLRMNESVGTIAVACSIRVTAATIGQMVPVTWAPLVAQPVKNLPAYNLSVHLYKILKLVL